MIIDIHCHLGDILYPNGGNAVMGRLPMARPLDPDALRRLFLYGFHGLDESFYKHRHVEWLMTRAERLRNATGTLQNLSRRLDRHGIDFAAVMPVAPHVAFEDLLPAAQADRRVLPFGSFDFTRADLAGQGLRQLALGAKGFKLHPILQRVPPDGQQVMEALSPLPPGTAILLHAGTANYYPAHEQHLQTPEHGGIAGIETLCRAFPHLRFVAAHGGLRQFGELIERLAPLPNTSVDTSFVSPAGIRLLIAAFGAGRVLFASDWPWGFYHTGLAAVRAACRDELELEMVLGKNAEELLQGCARALRTI